MKLLAIIIGLSACSLASAEDGIPPSSPSPLSAAGGRFVFGQIGRMRADQFMLDTMTGRLWALGYSKDGTAHLDMVIYSNGDPTGMPPDDPDTEIKKAIEYRKMLPLPSAAAPVASPATAPPAKADPWDAVINGGHSATASSTK